MKNSRQSVQMNSNSSSIFSSSLNSSAKGFGLWNKFPAFQSQNSTLKIATPVFGKQISAKMRGIQANL